MPLNRIVAIRGDFDARFPESQTWSAGGDRVPGRDLAELVLEGLRRRGLEAEGPIDEEPFVAVRCRVGERQFVILCYIYEPRGKDSVWVVECPTTLGLLARLRGGSEEPELRTVLGAVQESLLHDARVREMRWFSRLPASPFSADIFSVVP